MTEPSPYPTTGPVCPACGMEVELALRESGSTAYGTAFGVAYQGKTYWLCCEDCRRKFEEDPRRYLRD